jgi:hypothetical protein
MSGVDSSSSVLFSGSSASGSSSLGLDMLKIQYRESQENLRSAEARIERLEAARIEERNVLLTEVEAYKRRVAELESNLSGVGSSMDKGKRRGI